MHSRARVLAPETRFQKRFQFFCSEVRPKSVFLQTIYLGCVWKRIQSREQNSAPESKCPSLLHSLSLSIHSSFHHWPLPSPLLLASLTPLISPYSHNLHDQSTSLSFPSDQPSTLHFTPVLKLPFPLNVPLFLVMSPLRVGQWAPSLYMGNQVINYRSCATGYCFIIALYC